MQATIASRIEEYYFYAALSMGLHADWESESDDPIKSRYFNNKTRYESLNATIMSNLAKFDPENSITSQVRDLSMPVDIRLALQPALPGWSVSSSSVRQINGSVTDRRSFTQSAIMGKSVDIENFYNISMLEYSITYQRSNFTKIFAMFIVVTMWALSIYLLVLAVDHVIIRIRPLEADTVGYSVGMLFALPALRLLLPAPFGR